METFLEKLIKGVGGVIMAGLILFFVSCISGTILWIIWDDCIPYIFKSLPTDLTWWQSVTFTWVCAILIQSSSSKSK